MDELIGILTSGPTLPETAGVGPIVILAPPMFIPFEIALITGVKTVGGGTLMVALLSFRSGDYIVAVNPDQINCARQKGIQPRRLAARHDP
jgi:hypothetical protein